MGPHDQDLQDLLDRTTDDADLRAEILAHPRRVLERELGIELPADADIRVIEERANQLHLILPEITDAELSDDELEAVAGGILRSDVRRPTGTSWT